MLTVRHLTVAVADRVIVKDLSFSISPGEVWILFGPNGSGKTSLIKAILGLAGYRIVSGEVLFNGEAINGLPADERVRKGIGVMYQRPPSIRGVTLRQIGRFLAHDDRTIEAQARGLSLTGLLDRDINRDFSGGEIKRSELFQVLLQDPAFVLLDEPESGVDIENIALMGRTLNRFLRQPGKAGLIITHTGYILDYVDARTGCVLIDGRFQCQGYPREIFKDIQKGGYAKCVHCHDQQKVSQSS